MPHKVLLSTVFRPFGVDDGYGRATTLAEFHHSNLTGAQGHFSIRGANPHLGLHFLAENLRAPVTLLENPTLDEFTAEVRRGGYSHVGVSFEPTTFAKAQAMCRGAKAADPRVVTVVGGYGTACPEADALADHVCRGEGVRFMRELLGEDPETPFRHPRVYNTEQMTMGIVDLGIAAVISTGLGCPNGCEFCITSHYFDCKHIPFMKTGDEIYDTMLDVAKGMPPKARTGSYDFLVIEEDFLLHEKRVRELLACMRRPDAPLFLFTCFGSAAAVARYEIEELVAMGLDGVWVGVEGPSAPGYSKLRGVDMKDLFRKLHAAGIMTVASMIIGYDVHDEASVRRDIEWHLELKSTFNQFMLYTPLPGTPLFRGYGRQGRILERPWRDFDGWHFTVDHPNLTPAQAEGLQRHGYRRDFEDLGPGILRTVEISLNGYLAWRDSKDPLLRRRAEANRKALEFALAVFPASRRRAPSPQALAWIEDLERRIVAEIGRPGFRVWAASWAVEAAVTLKGAWETLSGRGELLQVRPRRTEFRALTYEMKLVALRDEILERLENLRDQGREHLESLRDRGRLQLERTAEAVAVEIRGALSRRDLDALRAKLRALATAGQPVILYASSSAAISREQFDAMVRRLRRTLADLTILCPVDWTCAELAAAAPLRVYS